MRLFEIVCGIHGRTVLFLKKSGQLVFDIVFRQMSHGARSFDVTAGEMFQIMEVLLRIQRGQKVTSLVAHSSRQVHTTFAPDERDSRESGVKSGAYVTQMLRAKLAYTMCVNN
jgi:hypothetical protein